MPTISGKQTLTAGQEVTNVFLGSQYELAPFDGTIEIGLFASGDSCQCAIFSGPDTLQEPGGFVPFGAAAAAPKYPDDYHWEDEVAKGDRMKLTLRNTHASASRDVYWAMRMTPA